VGESLEINPEAPEAGVDLELNPDMTTGGLTKIIYLQQVKELSLPS